MTSIITPTFVSDLKTRVQDIANEDYQRLKQDIWWNKIATALNSTTKKERLTWLLSTGLLEEVAHDGGEVAYDTLLRASTEFENKFVRKGLKVKFEEFDGPLVGRPHEHRVRRKAGLGQTTSEPTTDETVRPWSTLRRRGSEEH